MLRGTLIGDQVWDVRATLDWLQRTDEFRGRPTVLWGESLIPPNPPDAEFHQPRDSDEALPNPSEPSAPLVVMLAALGNKDITAVYAVGGLASWQSLLESYLVLTSYDALIPGILEVCDIPDLVAGLENQRVRLEVCVDGWNRLADPRLNVPHASYSPTRTSIAAWLATQE
jgi:hypothetical protein